MATYTASQAKTVTLTNGQVDTITLRGTGQRLHIAITSNHKPVYFTMGYPSDTIDDPSVAGDDCYVFDYQNIMDFPWSGTGAKVKVIAAGTPTITVMLIP
jgi:hypothetical protein